MGPGHERKPPPPPPSLPMHLSSRPLWSSALRLGEDKAILLGHPQTRPFPTLVCVGHTPKRLHSSAKVQVGPIDSDQGLVQGYFKLQLFDVQEGEGEGAQTEGGARAACEAEAHSDEGGLDATSQDRPRQRPAVLVVAFGSAPGVPNWGRLLDRVAESMRTAADRTPFDVYFVVDPGRQWFGGGTADAAPFATRLARVAARYRRVVMLGDSMGGTGALLFADMATRVLAFCPQVDLSTASIRPAYNAERFRALRRDVEGALGRCAGRVDVHTGTWKHDEDQAAWVAGLPGVTITRHPADTHRVALWLNRSEELLQMVRSCIVEEGRMASQVRCPQGEV